MSSVLAQINHWHQAGRAVSANSIRGDGVQYKFAGGQTHFTHGYKLTSETSKVPMDVSCSKRIMHVFPCYPLPPRRVIGPARLPRLPGGATETTGAARGSGIRVDGCWDDEDASQCASWTR